MQNLLSFVVVIGFLIFFHELGHFLFARIFGVWVEKFSIGFGPKIVSKKYKDTEYILSAIPLGGYVKMFGENSEEPIKEEEQKLSFSHKNSLQKFIIVAAGPIFNLLLGAIIIFFLFLTIGYYSLSPEVGEIRKDSPAEKAGLLKNDIVHSINNQKISNWEDMVNILNEGKGEKIGLAILRDKKIINFEIVPEIIKTKNIFGEPKNRFIIGITASGKTFHNSLSVPSAFIKSITYSYEMTKLTFLSVVKMIQGKLDLNNVGGPIMIAKIAGEKAQQGFADFLFFLSIISINLGVLNLLPIPVLDGGHLMFFTFEAILRRPVNIKIQNAMNKIGIVFLLTFMMYVIYNDVLKLFK